MLKRVPWTVVLPSLAFVALVLTWGKQIGPVVGLLAAVLLAGAVLAAVNHAEVVAARVGEPFGSLVLAVAVTTIEVALIVALMVSGGDDAATLARDTVFAAVMITTNGIAGLSLLLGSLRYGVTLFNPPRQRRRAGHGHHTGDAEPGAAHVHHQSVGPRAIARPAHLRRRRVAGTLRVVPVHPDCPASRLLPTGGAKGRGRG